MCGVEETREALYRGVTLEQKLIGEHVKLIQV